MKTQSKKAKGRLGQQEIRDKLLKAFPHLEPGDVLSCSMGASGNDILLSPKAKESIPLAIEVKRRKSGYKTIYDHIEQADNKDGSIPVAFIRQDRKDWLTIVPTDYFMELLKK